MSAMNPQKSLLMVPCGLHDAAECLLRPSSMLRSCSLSWQPVLGSQESVTVWANWCSQQLVCVKRGEAGGCAHQALKMGMQVRCMLQGKMA